MRSGHQRKNYFSVKTACRNWKPRRLQNLPFSTFVDLSINREEKIIPPFFRIQIYFHLWPQIDRLFMSILSFGFQCAGTYKKSVLCTSSFFFAFCNSGLLRPVLPHTYLFHRIMYFISLRLFGYRCHQSAIRIRKFLFIGENFEGSNTIKL